MRPNLFLKHALANLLKNDAASSGGGRHCSDLWHSFRKTASPLGRRARAWGDGICAQITRTSVRAPRVLADCAGALLLFTRTGTETRALASGVTNATTAAACSRSRPSSLESCCPRDKVLSLPIHACILSHLHPLHPNCLAQSERNLRKPHTDL